MIMSRRRAIVLGVAAAVAVPLLFTAAPAMAAADGCEVGFSTDFNGDGFSDAVVADPSATVGGAATAGRLVVFYGDADGRIGEGTRGTVTQNSPSVGDGSEAGDRFGFALAVADVDCDEYTDVVVGSPYEDVGGQTDAGLVQIVKGGPGGLGSAGSDDINITDFGEVASAGDQFGYAVDALEDVGQGATPEPFAHALAFGAPGVQRRRPERRRLGRR